MNLTAGSPPSNQENTFRSRSTYSSVTIASVSYTHLIDDGLALDNILVVRKRHIDVCKDLEIRTPTNAGTRSFFIGGFLFESADIFTVLKVKTCLLYTSRCV